MTSKQIKTGLAKSAGSSPAQSSKLSLLADSNVESFIKESVQEAVRALLQEQNVKEQAMANQHKQMMEQMMKRMDENMAKQSKELQEGFSSAVNLISNKMGELDEKFTQANVKTEAKILEIQNRVDGTEDEMTLMQYRAMEFALRVRGLKENGREDLKEILSEIFAKVLGAQTMLVSAQIDKIYRVNSWVARQRQLPRDVVIYFTSRCFRNEILQAFYKNKFQGVAKELIILKEIPPKMLRARKDFAFLTDELKKRQIQFRWDVPAGVILNYLGGRYRLNTLEKARDFFENVLIVEQRQSSSSSSPGEKRRQVQAVEMTAAGGPSTSQALVQATEALEQREVGKDKRQTRLAKKKMEEERMQQSQAPETRTEAVGGALSREEVAKMVLQVLQGFKDGN